MVVQSSWDRIFFFSGNLRTIKNDCFEMVLEVGWLVNGSAKNDVCTVMK
jgi:hypothetical protein